MYPFVNTSILRERFVIHDAKKNNRVEPVTALGNRIVVSLKSADGKHIENLVVRGRYMHAVARVAARLFLDFEKKGSIVSRTPQYDWDGLWASIHTTFEQKYNPESWLAIYNKGRKIYEHGENHPFLDVMEQCDANNRDEYDHALIIAENVFEQAGKTVKIEKDTNIAAVISANNQRARCGLILRTTSKSSTFSISMEPAEQEKLSIASAPEAHICLNISAAFLEMIQLSFVSGQLKAKIKSINLGSASPEAIQLKEAERRIGRLNSEIKSYEARYKVHYRPERPNVLKITNEAKQMFDDIYASNNDRAASPLLNKGTLLKTQAPDQDKNADHNPSSEDIAKS